MATWPSWPQACILPWCRLAWAKVLCSVMGSASMSARRPTARLPGRPWITPTTPVLPRPRCTSMPQFASVRATRSEVRSSSKQSSGWAWMSRRMARIASASASSSGRTAWAAAKVAVMGRSRSWRGLSSYCGRRAPVGCMVAGMGLAGSAPMLESAVLDKGLAEAVNMLWLVVAGALVFFMQAGFAFLESGMTRAKNTVNVIMKNYCDMCFGAVAFWLVGYGLMFGANHTGWLGTSAFALQGVPESQYGGLFFQMMFAATSATIVSGAIAERTRFSAYVIGSVFITALFSPVFGALAWGGAALAALLVVGPRLGRFGPDGRPREIQGHNLTLVAMGAFILWLGWFGFNAGSTMSASVGLGRIALTTRRGGAAGALGAVATRALLRSKLMMTLTLNGSIAGLVSVTAGCHVMEPGFAVLTGFIGGALSVLASPLLDRLRVDDVVGAVSVHVVGGVWGTLAAGLFRSGHLFDLSQLGVQALGSLAAFVWGFGGSLLMYWLLDKFVPMRASTIDEQRGLDFSEHHELGYPEFQQEAVHRGVRHG